VRILHVTRETAGDRRFGIGRSLLPVTDALQARGHQVRYLTLEDMTPRAQRAQAELLPWLQRLAGLAFGAAGRTAAMAWVERLNIGRLAAKLASTQGYDVVHLHDPWMGWAFRRASLWHRPARRLRWGFTQHGFGAYAHATHEEGLPATPAMLRHSLRLEAALVRKASFVFCPTDAARQQLARDLMLPASLPQLHTVPHGKPDLQLPERSTARASLALPDDLPMVLAIGRINPVKRLQHVVQACGLLQRPMRLVLLAAGGDAAPLQRLAQDWPALQLDIRLVEDVAPFLAAADVYISASINESFGLANLEAMLAGLPMICTAVGGVPEVTAGAAWLVAGGEAELAPRLAAALQTLLTEPGLRQTLANAARARGAAWPDAAKIANDYERIYLDGR